MITTNRIRCGQQINLSGEAAATAAAQFGTEAGQAAAQMVLGCPCGKQGPCTCGRDRGHRGPVFTGSVNLSANVKPGAVDVDFRIKGTFSKKKPALGIVALAGLIR